MSERAGERFDPGVDPLGHQRPVPQEQAGIGGAVVAKEGEGQGLDAVARRQGGDRAVLGARRQVEDCVESGLGGSETDGSVEPAARGPTRVSRRSL